MPQSNPSDITGADSGMSRPDGTPLSERRGGRAGAWRRTARAVGGMALVLLGLLWILQGADVVRIRPILCVAECRPVTGGSTGWLAVGVATFAVGLYVVGVQRRREKSPSRLDDPNR